MFNGTLLDFFWTMAIIFFWVIAIMIWFRCLMDLFGREDLTGLMKGIWIVALIIIPWLGRLVYLIARGSGMQQRQLEQVREAQAAQPEYEALTAKALA